MKTLVMMLSVVIFGEVAFADDAADRAKLLGTWQLEHGNDKEGSIWMLEDRNDVLHIVQSQNSQKLAEFECGTGGRDCDATDSGHQAKVSMWFSGPKLVQLETRGNDVIKRRFAIVGQGDAMEVEVLPIVPAGKTEILQFKRIQQVSASQK